MSESFAFGSPSSTVITELDKHTKAPDCNGHVALRRFSILLIALLFIAAGALHFIFPLAYLKQMPAYLPWPRPLVFISGAFEILGGLGVLFSATRRFAGLGLIALLLAVFPVNIHMFTTLPPPQQWTPVGILLFLRLPIQFLLIYWIYRSTIRPSGKPAHANPPL